MQSADVPAALAIIKQHNSDDYDVAKQSYRRSIEGQYVLERAGTVLGLTGWREIPEADRTYWLSWTYLAQQERGQGLGIGMLSALLDILRQRDARKIFVFTSDLGQRDGKAGDYSQAIQVYQRLGFIEELRHPDYYDPGESLIALGLRIEETYTPEPAPPELRNARLIGAEEIVETNDAYAIDWELVSGQGASPEDVSQMVEQVRAWGGRVLFADLASDAPLAQGLFLAGGFTQAGRLSDFYEDGIDAVHYRLNV
jgi:ribosomal protein S18 acetylase RimI-like enzyme